MLLYERPNELYHYGVKGMKWGVRKNPANNAILKKGTTVKRVSLTGRDETYDNKKYVSINQEDHDAWVKFLGEAYVARNHATYDQSYVTTKNLKIMGSIEQGKLYTEMRLNSDFATRSISDDKKASDYFREKYTDNVAENISRNMAAQTETGKAFAKKILEKGYDGVFDTYGTSVSKSPVIIFDPDNNLKRDGNPDYTKPVKDFLTKYYSGAVIPA